MAKRITLQDIFSMLKKLVRNTSGESLVVNAAEIRRREPLVDITKLSLDGRIRQGTKDPVYWWPDAEKEIEKYFFSLPKSGTTYVQTPQQIMISEGDMESLIPNH